MSTLQPGLILKDRYRLTTELGQGGYGTVWSAEDLRRDQRVAIKLLSPQLHNRRDAEERLAREAEVLLSLRHPNIVGAQDFYGGDEQLPAFLVLDFISGQSLSEHIKDRARSGRRFTSAEAQRIFGGICEAVQFAHEAGVIHRDLKPANIMLQDADSQAPRALVLDFGLAKILHGDTVDATTLGRRLGTFLYMSPEQALGQPTGPGTDIFGLGTVLFELLTLHRAWATDAQGRGLPMVQGPIIARAQNSPGHILRRIASGPRPKLSDHRPELGHALAEVLTQSLHARPELRPSSAAELWRQVQSALPQTGEQTARIQRFGDVEVESARLPQLEGSPPAVSTALAAPANNGNAAAALPRRRSGWALAALVSSVAGGLVLAGVMHQGSTPAPAPPAASLSTPQAAPGVVATQRELHKPRVPAPATKAPSPAKTPALAKTTPRRSRAPRSKAPARLPKLEAQLAELRAHPEDVVRLEALSEALIQRAKQMPDRSRAVRVQRLARTAAMVGDIDALAAAIEALKAD